MRMYSSLRLSLTLVLALLYETNAYKILVVSPFLSKSHAILGEAMVQHLSKAGHEVTFVTMFVPDQPSPKVTVVDISDNFKYFPQDGSMNIKAIMNKTTETSSLFHFVPMIMNITRLTVEHGNVQKLITDRNQQFDVVIAEWMFSEIYAGFAGVFDCPLIWFSTVEPHWMVTQLIDEIPNSAYTVDTSSDRVPPLTFVERAVELCSQIIGKLIQIFWISGFEDALYKELFVPVIRSRRNFVPSLQTLRYNGSLVLSNSHISTGVPARLPPNFIHVGGFHIESNIKPLPKEIQKVMDDAKNGVIYFSMGTNLRSKHFPDVIKQDLLKMFGKLKQTVIWKFEEDLPNKPSNVHIVQWAPQQSILGHKHCALFITHGGLLSTTETIHFGVPIIGIPGFGDQYINVERSVKKGFAKKVDLSYVLAADLKVAIEEILSSPKYTAKARELSQIYHDRPITPAKELVHWVEHVIKTRGALHLRSPALSVSWYQKFYLDLVTILLIVFAALKYALIFIKCKIENIVKRKEKIN